MSDTFQKYYGDKVGSAGLNVQKVVAGSLIDLNLTYKVGALGIDDSGSMKVLLRIVSDCGDPQFEDANALNYVDFTTNKKDLNISVVQKSAGVFGKVHERPWSKGFVIVFSGESLAMGDEVYINFKNWKVQTFTESKFKFKILVDPFASARFVELPISPTLQVIPGSPKKLKLIAPSLVKTGEKFGLGVILEDEWGNTCTNHSGEVAFEANDRLQCPAKTKIEKGLSKVSLVSKIDGVHYISAEHKNLSSSSNPIVSTQKPKNHYFWGDFHGQSNETVGTNDIDEYFTFARDYAFLDFAGHQGNDFQVTNDFWKKINETTKKLTSNGRFIAIPGYEWSGNTPVGGDRNVIYLNEGSPIFRSSHALLSDLSDVGSDVDTVTTLFKKLQGNDALTLAHVGGRYSNLEMHNENLCPTVEIHSDWGTFEWFLFDALDSGHKVGIIANSDCHDGRPGASYPGNGHFYSYGGLTCVIADDLNRKSIFEALKKRNVYATTGERIFLDTHIELNNEKKAIMGDEIKNDSKFVFNLVALGTSPIDRVEIYDKSKLIQEFYPVPESSTHREIKVSWMGSSAKGRKRNFSWKGSLEVQDNLLVSAEKFNFFNKYIFENEADKINWNSTTTGGTQGVVVGLKNNNGQLALVVNDKKISLDISKISQKPSKFDFGGLDAKLEVYEVLLGSEPGRMDVEFPLAELKRGSHAIFAKVIQKNGHMAWSSPVYLR